MHIYFVGIGGTAIGPLALIAKQAGYTVSGSDKQDSLYIKYLKKQGIESIKITSSDENIAKIHQQTPIDWVVYTSAVPLENPNHPELQFAKANGIKSTKRDELLNTIIEDSGKKLIAIAGTHGKTTTTAMTIWLFQQLGIPVSYSVGAKIPFGDMGHFDKESEYFVYECDEFDYNFLAFKPYISMITGVDYDHHDIFPSRKDYVDAFQKFIDQSKHKVVWKNDLKQNTFNLGGKSIELDERDDTLNKLSIVGNVNRKNAWQVLKCVSYFTNEDENKLIKIVEGFPGVSRRFEKITSNLYTDYAHTAPKIEGALQLAKEVSDNVVVVYEPLTNLRQHYIRDSYGDLFEGIKKLYWVPTYLARENPDKHVFTPAELIEGMNNKEIAEPAELNDVLKSKIQEHLAIGDLVLCMTGGGGNSLDEWLRKEFN